VASTRVLIEVLRVWGVSAVPVEAQVSVFNAAAMDIVRAEGFPALGQALMGTSAATPGGAWSVGVGVLRPGEIALPAGDPFAPDSVGHVLGYVPSAGVLVDASIDQATREHKDLVVAPLAVAAVRPDDAPVWVDVAMPGGVGAVVFDPADTGRYRRSRNWRLDAVNTSIVGAVVRALRAQDAAR